ncbi:MAG: hypothetical protein ACK5NT_14900 [Pyrinomonadaceae bacterium]
MEENKKPNINAPATALLTAGILNCVLGVFAIISGLLRIFVYGIMLPQDKAQRSVFLVVTALFYFLGLFGVIVAPFVIKGAMNMKKHVHLKRARLAAVLVIVPLSCLFIITSPIGIWAFLTLNRKDVKNLFVS